VSTIGVAIVAVAGWWVFGAAMWLSNPEAFAAKSALKQEVHKEIPYSDMTNAQLREASLKFVSRLRELSSKIRELDEKDRNERMRKMLQVRGDQAKEQAIWNDENNRDLARYRRNADLFKSAYLVDAQLLNKELKQRAPPSALLEDLTSGTRGRMTMYILDDGSLSGPDPVGELANYLEALAKQLPRDG
jgi:hypothetical protein